jgi:hypothetical protein
LKKPLTIGLLTAAIIAGVLSLVRVDGGAQAPANVVTEAAAADSEAAPAVIRMAQLAVSTNAPAAPYMLDYQRGPRIIHVPQPGEGTQERTQERTTDRAVKKPTARASVERRPEPSVTADDEDDDVEVAPSPPPRPRAPAPKPRAAAAPLQPPAAITPRWKLRSDTPPPPPPPLPGPRRAVLSAPPLGTFGPTPIRPTPNFDNKAADRNEKFVAPREPVASPPIVTESQPPLGYSPPATAATPEPPAADVTSAAPSAEPSPEN